MDANAAKFQTDLVVISSSLVALLDTMSSDI